MNQVSNSTTWTGSFDEPITLKDKNYTFRFSYALIRINLDLARMG